MKSIAKSSLLLFGLVLTVYLARQSDVSFTKAFRGSMRSLGGTIRSLTGEVRPSEKLCVGIDLDKPVSEAQINKAASLRKQLEGMRGGNPLYDYINEGKSKDDLPKDYAIPLIGVIAPWIVFFFITFMLCCVFVCNWCCMYGICKSCKICKCCKEPKESSKKKIFAGFTALFLLCAIGSSAAGLTFSSGVSKGMELTLCSFINAMEDLAYGVDSEDWIGITGAVDSLTNILGQFDNIVDNLGDMQTELDDLTNSLNTAITAANTLYTNHQGDTVQRASSVSTYVPEYIANLGPETDDDTFMGAIRIEMEAKRDIVDTAATPVKTAIDSLQSNKASIRDALSQGKTQGDDIKVKLNDIFDKVNDNGKTVKDVASIVGSALTGVFGANLGVAVFAFTCMVLVGVLKIKFFNKLLHLSWCLIYILTMLGFLLAVLTYPLSVVMIEGCQVLDANLNDPVYFEKTMDLAGLEGKPRDTIYTCLHGDGDILSQFGITTQIGYFDTIYNQITDLSAQFDIDATTPMPSFVIPFQYDLIDGFKTGRYIDATESGQDLALLNSKVDHDSTSCTLMNDAWAFNSMNCTAGQGTQFVNSNGDAYNAGNPTCIGFDEWTDPISRDITNRYQTGTFGCTPSDVTTAQTLVSRFVTARGQLSTIMTNIENDMDNIDSAHTAFANSFLDVLHQFRNLRDDLGTIRDSIMGPDNGIISNANCNFIGTDLKLLQQSMCIGFISSLYQTSIVIIITSFFTMFSMVAIFCLAKRFVTKDKNSKVSP